MSDLNHSELIREIDAANDLVWNLRTAPTPNYDPEHLIEDALTKSRQINYQLGIARCYLNQAMGAFIIYHDHQLTEELITKAETIFKEIKNEKWIANNHLTHAIIKNSTGSPENALYLGLKGIDYYEKNPNDPDVPMAYYVVGTIYKDLKKNEQAQKHFEKGLSDQYPPNSWTARILTGLSNIYNENHEFDKAISYGLKSLAIIRPEKNLIAESRTLNDIGLIYKRSGNYEQALDYFHQALELRKIHGLKHFILGSLLEIAAVNFDNGDFDKALAYYTEAESNAIETNHFARLSLIYHRIAVCYKAMGKINRALDYYEKLTDINTKLSKQEKEEKIIHSENKLLKEKEDEIERLKNVELKNAYELIAEKNKEITDSIHYAKRIQATILASEEQLKKGFKHHFVFYHPKDIVSGDFYWAASVPQPTNENEDAHFIAVCDSTGHGVPGAFMSLLNTTYLNEAVNEKRIQSTGKIFDHVRDKLIANISREGQKDGFDGILLRYCKNEKQLQYAAANNQPVVIRKGAILELPKDRMPVGIGEMKTPFTEFTFTPEAGDMLYLFTDGFADQFGGPKGKKYKYSRLNELLVSIADLPLSEQEQKLRVEFLEWKGELEQVDDVCIIGIRL